MQNKTLQIGPSKVNMASVLHSCFTSRETIDIALLTKVNLTQSADLLLSPFCILLMKLLHLYWELCYLLASSRQILSFCRYLCTKVSIWWSESSKTKTGLISPGNWCGHLSGLKLEVQGSDCTCKSSAQKRLVTRLKKWLFSEIANSRGFKFQFFILQQLVCWTDRDL